MDWFLLACVAVLVTYGVLFVGSAQGSESARSLKQLMWIAVGAVALIATVYVDYMKLLRRANVLYGVGLFLLVAVLFTRPINNARSWFDLGFFKAQPSEFVKLLWVVAMAHALGTQENYRKLSGLWMPLALTLIPVALILRQPDLGTAMIFIPAFFAILYAAGARLRDLSVITATGIAGAGVLWAVFMRDYQKRRILAWLDPTAYRATDAYQMTMARIAIGSGGISGQGLGKGTLNKLNYVPVKDTDLIFSVIAEEWGLLGCLGLLLVLGLLIVACLEIARRSREPQGRLIAVGVASLIGFQTIVNLWVAVGLLPTTGVTLPFVSYGGSSLLSSFLCIGLALNVGLRRHSTLARDPFAP
jgi:rod shape determining protein RodA